MKSIEEEKESWCLGFNREKREAMRV